MKKTALIVAVAGMATALQAAPQESVTFTNVGSFNRWGVAGNSIQTATFTGSYNVAKINISGTLTPTVAGNFYREASIQVTSPTGQKFIITPLTGTTGATPTTPANVPAGAYTQLPLSEAANGGTWTFEFFESYDDNAGSTTIPDSTWNTITLTLDDATVAPPPAAIPTSPSATFTNVPSEIGFNNTAANWTTLTFDVPASQTQTVDTVVISGMGTGVSGTVTATNNSLNGTPTGTMMVRVAPPWAPNTFTARALPLTNGTTSSSSTGVQTFYPLSLASLATLGTPGNDTAFFIPPLNSGVAAAASGPAAGTWTVQVMQNFATATAPAFTGHWQSLSVSLTSATPPAVLESFTLLDGGTITKTGTFAAVGEKKWYKFTVPAGVTISPANGNALDIGMFGTSLAPQNDTCLAIYTSTGGLFATSFNTGPGALPQMSFGRGIRNPQGPMTDADPGLPFDGANPNIAPPNPRGNVTPGDYYVLVCNGDDGVTFRAGLFNADASTENNVGSYSVMFRSWLATNSAPFDVPGATDLGTVEGPVMSQTATLNAGTRYKWYKFTLPEEVSEATGKYLDIDTASTLAPINDTNIAVYDSTGVFKGSNDDIAGGWGAENPTGGNSALSFGDSSGGNGRDYTAINPNLPLAFGGDGVLAAGTYYLQVSTCCATYNANRFWVVNDYVTTVGNGDMAVNLRSNFPEAGSPCGPADIGAAGGEPGSDGHLDNNDFIAFINFFFDQDPLADLGVAGGEPGSDGLWDNNDFIAFINHFFDNAALCP